MSKNGKTINKYYHFKSKKQNNQTLFVRKLNMYISSVQKKGVNHI